MKNLLFYLTAVISVIIVESTTCHAQTTQKKMIMTTSKLKISPQFIMQGSGNYNIDWGDGTATIADELPDGKMVFINHSYTDVDLHTIIITGENITLFNCSNNILTSLDVSNNTVLTMLNCSYNQLKSLDLSNNTALTELSCGSNELSDSALNALFETLNNNEGKKIISIRVNLGTNNPGIANCDRSIATNKGWTVL